MVRLVAVNRQIIGPYQIRRVIARGGMGTVYEAVHAAIERRAAIKVLRDDLGAEGELTERFLNEARAVNRIGHPGIVQIYDVGRLEDESIYLVMEYLDGVTLGQRFKERGGLLPPAEAVPLGREVAHALAAAHDKGIVHRDLKPDNIMIVAAPHTARGECAKLLDFGIAKLAQSASEAGAGANSTKVGTTMGTPWYMSPEQVVNTSGVGDRSDVYSLGVLLYQALSGQLPLRGDSDFGTMSLHVNTRAPALASVAPAVPERLAQLVDAMLAKSPAERPRMVDVVRELALVERTLATPGEEAAPPVTGRALAEPREVPVPMTLVASGRRSGAPPAGPALPAAPAAPPEPSSATPSTLSGAASQNPVHAGAAARRWFPWLAPAAVAMLGLGLWSGRFLQPRPPAGSTVAVVTPRPVAPPPVAPPPPTIPSPQPAPALSAPDPKHVVKPTPPVPRAHCVPVRPDGACIQAPRQRPGEHSTLRDFIVSALRSADIRLCRGEALRMYRLNRMMREEGKNSQIRSGQIEVFAQSLQGRLGDTPLPEEIQIICPK